MVQETPAHPELNHYREPGGHWVGDLQVDWAFTPSVPYGNWRSRVYDGVSQWNSLGQTLNLTKTPDYTFDFDPYAICAYSYQDNGIHRRHLPPPVAGRTVFCAPNQVMYHAQVIFDESLNWYTGTGDAPGDSYDLWSVATHELGHLTGWGPHITEAQYCPNNSTQQTMCEIYYQGTERMRTLATHDKHTFDAAY
jgi:hypothetical protein